jgi:hypothetical protein
VLLAEIDAIAAEEGSPRTHGEASEFVGSSQLPR